MCPGCSPRQVPTAEHVAREWGGMRCQTADCRFQQTLEGQKAGRKAGGHGRGRWAGAGRVKSAAKGATEELWQQCTWPGIGGGLTSREVPNHGACQQTQVAAEEGGQHWRGAGARRGRDRVSRQDSAKDGSWRRINSVDQHGAELLCANKGTTEAAGLGSSKPRAACKRRTAASGGRRHRRAPQQDDGRVRLAIGCVLYYCSTRGYS